jgi:hypothetical protein
MHPSGIQRGWYFRAWGSTMGVAIFGRCEQRVDDRRIMARCTSELGTETGMFHISNIEEIISEEEYLRGSSDARRRRG